MSTSPSPSASSPTNDPFETLLHLEDTLYTTAYTLGTASGAQAGRIEGRLFGLSTGFEKFAAMGTLFGRSVVWGSRLPHSSSSSTTSHDRLPPLPPNPRLQTHISHLHSLTDPTTFSSLNKEEAVNDFDARFKRAGAKGKMVERITGEMVGVDDELEMEMEIDVTGKGKEEDIGDDGEEEEVGGVKKSGKKGSVKAGRIVQKRAAGGGGGGGGDGQMEDFKLRGLEI
jgi:hypothetical protein